MTEKQGKQDWTRREFIAAGSSAAIAAALPMACGKKTAKKNQSSPPDPQSSGTSWAGTAPVMDLSEYLHMADMDHFGQFVDFGTAARFKYTMGEWMTGWANDSVMNGVTFTWATSSPSRLYVDLEKPTDLQLVFRAKAGGTDYFSVYMNDNPISRISLKGKDFDTYTLDVKAEHTRSGENYLKLIYPAADSKVAGSPAAFALDYLRIVPTGASSPKETFEPPHLSRMIQRFKMGDDELNSIMMVCPTRLSYYIDVPADSQFCALGAPILGAQDKAKGVAFAVSVTPVDTGKTKELFKKSFKDTKRDEIVADLKDFKGKLVRLDLKVDGPSSSRFALGIPTIRKGKVQQAPDKKMKNVVMVVIDTLRADKLKSYGNKRVKTVGTQAFSTEGTVFDHCQANSNWTKPSCGTILTGLHPDTHLARGHSSRLSKSVKMASEMFKSEGFATGAFIANGYLATEFGFNRGWDTYVNYIRERKNTDAENVYKDTLEFIKTNKEKPFFTYIQTIDPHVPYDPPDEDLKLYDARSYDGPVQPRSTGQLLEDFKRKRVTLNTRDRQRLEALYDGEVTYHDRQFDTFIKGLKKNGVLDDTLIIVTSDHGEEFFEHDSVGHGHSMYQELLHVPMLLRAPGLVPKGSRCSANTCLADIVPTALAATGRAIPKEVEGRSILPEANGVDEHPMGAAFSSFYSEADSRNLQWTVRKGDWKLRMRGPVNTYLYNLVDDPGEKVDVDDDFPVARRAMRVALGQFIGAPDKSEWFSGHIKADVVGKPEAKEDSNENIPDDLKKQLQELGYML